MHFDTQRRLNISQSYGLYIAQQDMTIVCYSIIFDVSQMCYCLVNLGMSITIIA